LIWVTWAQHRREALVSGVILMVATALLVITGLSMLADFEHSGTAACAGTGGTAVGVFLTGSPCDPVIDSFTARWFQLKGTAELALWTLPALLGVFIAAPLLSREFEQGTHLFAWSQSITRLRWALVKLGLISAFVLIAAAAIATLAAWWHAPLDRAGFNGWWDAFDVEGIAPVAYAAFALALGSLAGLLLRRTVPAMALTLFVFVAVRILIVLVRPHFMTAVTGSALDLRQGSWLLTSTYYADAQGHRLSFEKVNEMTSVYITKTQSSSGVMDYLHQQGINLLAVYQPLDRFWTFQLVEAAIFLGLALVLFVLSAWWLQKRVR